MVNVIGHRGKKPNSLSTKLEKLYEAGLSVDEIAARVGEDRTYTYKMMRLLGLQNPDLLGEDGNDIKVLRPMPNGVCYACEVYEPMGHDCGKS